MKFENIEWYKDIVDLINSKWYVVYSWLIDYLITKYTEEILIISKDKNKQEYTEHDLNRKMLWILKDMKQSPITALSQLWATVQDDENSSAKIAETIKTAKRKIGSK